MSTHSICLVEDDPIMGESLVDRFQLEGLGIRWFRMGHDAKAALERDLFGVVICDIRLPDTSGDALYQDLRVGRPALPPFIFITGYGELDRAVQLIKLGAADYITKPFDLDQLVDRVKTVIGPSHLAPDQGGDSGQLGVSPPMRHIEGLLRRLGPLDTNVLITGETGVGKEVVARRLHDLGSAHRGGPFCAQNCAALPDSLAESELFGHEKGAFTGANQRHIGVFERANGGTLFLDEIGDMPLGLQAKLLRVLQEKSLVRVGGSETVPINVRVICATHQNLKEMVAEGRFREDLFYRINVVSVEIPPLRERRDDILWLARLLLSNYAQSTGQPVRQLHPEAERSLLERPWPGNVRELGHCLERACILSDSPVLTSADLFLDSQNYRSTVSQDPTLQEYLFDCERRYITQALDAHEFQIGATAVHLGISRKNLWEKMKRLGIRREGS